MRRTLAGGLVVTWLAMLGVLTVPVAAPAGADVADRVGWWWKLQQSPTPEVVVPPPPVLVESDDLPVAADVTPEGLAIAAVRYLVPEGAGARLTLTSSGERMIAMPPGTSIDACITTGPWDGISNGRWDARPTYDCARLSAGGALVEDGIHMSFELPPAFQFVPGVIDVALVPRGTAVPWLVTFDSPDANALVITEDPGAGTGADLGGAVAPSDAGGELSAAPAVVPGSLGGDAGGLSGPAVGVVPGRTGRVPTVGLSPARARDAVGIVGGEGRERALAISALVLFALGFAWVLRRPGRQPRLLGSLAAHRRAGGD